MKKQDTKVSIKIEFTEGWEARLAKASYNLYERIETKKTKCEKISA